MPKRRTIVAEARDGDWLRAHVIEPPGCLERVQGFLVAWAWRGFLFGAGVVIGVVVE